MSKDFIVIADNNKQSFADRAYKDSKIKYSFDFSPWAEDNSDIDTVTWAVKAGDATVSEEALAVSTATGFITLPSEGKSQIQVKATGTSGEIAVTHIDILTTDPKQGINDYV